MAIVMPIDNGQIPDYKTSEKEEKKSQADASKDMFLQLLVAEMQYQDPLEPTDNSEYIQQLYSMSQTESILQVQSDVEKLQTKSMVGKYVSIQDPNTGDVVEGKVESVVDESEGTKVYINGVGYDAANITAIHDEEHYNATLDADTFIRMVEDMPNAEELTLRNKEDVSAMINMYNGYLSPEALSYVPKETITKMTELTNKMNALMAEANSGSVQDDTTPAEESEETINDEGQAVEAE